MWKELTFTKTTIVLAGFLIVGVVAQSCMAIPIIAGEPVYDAANFLKNEITAANSIDMLAKETDMLDIQIKSMKRLGHYNYNDVAKVVRHLQEITERGKALSYSMRDFDKKFNDRYPNYNKHSNLGSYKQAYTTWNETSLQTFQNTLAAMGVMAEDTKNEHRLLEKLRDQSKSEEGQTKLLQISHELAVNTNQNLSSLQEIISAQTNAQTAYMSHQVSKESYEDKSMEEVVDKIKKYEVPKKGNNYGKLIVPARRSA